MDFMGKVALITGASVGIGRAAAIKLAEYGAKLVLADINFEGLEKVKEELKKYTEDVLIFKCDISNENAVNIMAEKAFSHFGKIDILVNNAALWKDSVTFEESSVDLWKKYIDINVMGTVYVTKSVIGKMIENHYGRIISVASVAGVYGNGRMVHYSATKGAVIAMTKALAKEVSDKGVVVNAVSPGTVSPSEDDDIYYTQDNPMNYTGRTGSDSENAELICFLASDKSPYLSGQNIIIDGCRKML